MRSITDPEPEPEQDPQWWDFWLMGVCEVCGVMETVVAPRHHAKWHMSRGERP